MDARSGTFDLSGPIRPADVPALCARLSQLLEGLEADEIVCVVRDLEPGLATVDALARLQLAARRRGCRVLLGETPVALRALIVQLGLADVLPEG